MLTYNDSIFNVKDVYLNYYVILIFSIYKIKENGKLLQ